MKFIKAITFSLSLLIANTSIAQNSLAGTWRFYKVSSRDSVIISIKEKTKLRDFIIHTKQIDFRKVSPELTDTLNKYIDRQLFLITHSFIKFRTDSTFEITRNEILIPKAIPGIVTDSTISGYWHVDDQKQIISFLTSDGFHFQYKMISFQKESLQAGIIHSENKDPVFIISFTRTE